MFFKVFIVIYIYSFVYLCIYTPRCARKLRYTGFTITQLDTFNIYMYITPSNQHFKAFPMSKFNSETSFLSQLFKGNSNFTVWKPWKVIYLSVFYDFHCYLYLFPYMFIYAFIHLHINFLNPSRCLNSIPRQVFCINFSKRIQIS